MGILVFIFIIIFLFFMFFISFLYSIAIFTLKFILSYITNKKNFKKILMSFCLILIVVLSFISIKLFFIKIENDKINAEITEFEPLIEKMNTDIINNIDASYKIISRRTISVSNHDGKTFYSRQYKDTVVDYGETFHDEPIMLGVFYIKNNTNYDLYNIMLGQSPEKMIDVLKPGDCFKTEKELLEANSVYFKFKVKDFKLSGGESKTVLYRAKIDLNSNKVTLDNMSFQLQPNNKYSNIDLSINFYNENDECLIHDINLNLDNTKHYLVKKGKNKRWSITKK
ncbi:hypothetical protein AB8J25_002968 [Clostridium perfringens]